MKILTEGHKYVASNFENSEYGQTIQFIEKTPKEEGSTELITVNDGTTNEELLEILLDRMNYLNSKFPCRENSIVITHLDTALLWLNKRTNDRKKRNVEGTNQKQFLNLVLRAKFLIDFKRASCYEKWHGALFL